LSLEVNLGESQQVYDVANGARTLIRLP
jgi:hypothetical protein